jgi:hypothetical protein
LVLNRVVNARSASAGVALANINTNSAGGAKIRVDQQSQPAFRKRPSDRARQGVASPVTRRTIRPGTDESKRA